MTGSGDSLSHVTAHQVAISSGSHELVADSQMYGGADDPFDVTSDRSAQASDVTLRHNYTHDPATTQTHIDGLQVRGVAGLLVECNRFESGPYSGNQNAGVYLESANGGDSNVVVRGNWLVGFAWTFMVSATTTSLVGNHYAGAHWGPCSLLAKPAPSQSGNVDDATGKTATPCV